MKEKVALVTGASRGVGKGVAIALARAGYFVYFTARSDGSRAHPLGGSIAETEAAIWETGGSGRGLKVDHQRDEDVLAAVQTIRERHDHLDVLVNNAAAIPRELTQPGPFFEKSLDLLRIVDVGARSHYVMTHAAAPLLLRSRGALVTFTSSFGGRCYLHGPAYGMGKAAVDKMAMDMAVDFQPYGVAANSLWLGFVRTERNEPLFAMKNHPYEHLTEGAESPELIGRVIAQLHQDEARMERSGRVLIVAELAEAFGLVEEDGRAPRSHRSLLCDPPEPVEAKID